MQSPPIEFIDREQGYSKFPANNIKESLKVVLLLRLFELKRYFSVSLVGAFGAVVQLIIFNALRHFYSPELSNVLAIECAIISNFMLNHHFSFADRKKSKNSNIKFFFKKFLKFNFCAMGSLILQVGVVACGSYFFGRGFYVENLMVLTGILLASVISYYAYSRLV